jgi:hypothetical protein
MAISTITRPRIISIDTTRPEVGELTAAVLPAEGFNEVSDIYLWNLAGAGIESVFVPDPTPCT